MKPLTPLQAIRNHCTECMGGNRYEVRYCSSSETCALFPFRFGKNPHISGRKMTEEQRQAAVERLKKYRKKSMKED